MGRGLTSLQRCSGCVLQLQPTGQKKRCNKTSHISPACWTQENVEKNRNYRPHNIQKGETVDVAEECESPSLHRIFSLQKNRRTDPLIMLLGINGHNVEMEIKTGAAVSRISCATF